MSENKVFNLQNFKAEGQKNDEGKKKGCRKNGLEDSKDWKNTLVAYLSKKPTTTKKKPSIWQVTVVK